MERWFRFGREGFSVGGFMGGRGGAVIVLFLTIFRGSFCFVSSLLRKGLVIIWGKDYFIIFIKFILTLLFWYY